MSIKSMMDGYGRVLRAGLRTLLLVCACGFGQIAWSQNYRATYSEFGTLNHGTAVLTFNNDTWLYEMSYKFDVSIESGDVYIPEEDRKSSFDYNLFNYYSLKQNQCYWELLAANERVVVKDSISRLNWEIVADSTQTIGGHPCVMARCDLCGWPVKAWYATDVPVSCGPWRLWGLPGLIMKAYTDDGQIDIQMTSLSTVADAPTMPDLSKRKVISRDKYVAVSLENAKKLARTFSSLQDRESSMTADVKLNNPDKCFQ